MAKDPAVLFYTSDFLSGTALFTNEQKGQYIDLLCHQHQSGHLPEFFMLKILNTKDNPVWNKFKQDEKGLWYQHRMEEEAIKRIKYSESRRDNIKHRYSKKDTYVPTYEDDMKLHMENGNRNDNKDIDSIKGDRIIREEDFEELWKEYPNKDGKKQALRHFMSSVKTEKDLEDIKKALSNYKKTEKVLKGFIKNGSTWFNNWRDSIDYVEPKSTPKPLSTFKPFEEIKPV